MITRQGFGSGDMGPLPSPAITPSTTAKYRIALVRGLPAPSKKKKHLFKSSTIRQQVSFPCQLPERTTFCVPPKISRAIFFTGTKGRASAGRLLIQRLAAPIHECSSRDLVVAAENW